MTGQWFQNEVGSGGTVGITTKYARSGNGSAYFATTNDGSKGDLEYYLSGSPVALSSLSSIAYDFYRDASSTVNPNFSPVLRLDMLKDGSYAGSLVFENYYQNSSASPTNTWTTLSGNLSSGIFWATNSKLGPTFADANGGEKTLQQWINDNSGSTLSVFGVSIGVGSGWGNASFQGAADNVNVSFSGGTSINSNFEVAQSVAAVPEPATWALMFMGVGAIGYGLRRRKSAGALSLA